jgi:hypothetical protein
MLALHETGEGTYWMPAKCVLWALTLFPASGLLSFEALGQPGSVSKQSVSVPTVDDGPARGSTYLPIDSWIPSLDRLHALGNINYAYLGLRPRTRLSITHVLDQTANFEDLTSSDDQAYEGYFAVPKELNAGTEGAISFRSSITSSGVPMMMNGIRRRKPLTVAELRE